MLVTLVSFTVAALLIVLLPGPDSLVVVRGLVRGGRRGGALTAARVLAGLVVWVAPASLGLSALLQSSEIGYDTFRIAGAGYLLWIGAQSLRSIRHAASGTVAKWMQTPRVRGRLDALSGLVLVDFGVRLAIEA